MMIQRILLGCALLVAGCGGKGAKTSSTSGAGGGDLDTPAATADPEARRHALVAEGATCVPAALRTERAPQLRLAPIDGSPGLCAIDTAAEDNQGVLACWTIDAASGGLTYRAPELPPGVGLEATLDAGGCAYGYCVAGASGRAVIAHSTSGAAVAIATGGTVHLLDASSKQETKTLPLGDLDVAGLSFVKDTVYVEANAGDATHVHAFRTTDGKALGPVTQLGGKNPQPISIRHGGASVVDEGRIGLADGGLATLTLVEAATSRRSKAVRKVPPNPCKPKEMAKFGEGAKPACSKHVAEVYAPFAGVSLTALPKGDYLALLAGDRAGELVVLDGKTLTEERKVGNAYCAK